jgi:nucleoside-diphosphate-sugar epimerase
VQQVLVLGGASFVGGALAREALSRGWQVTCLTRGRQPLPAGVDSVVADRRDAAATTSALSGLTPDLVIDTWAGAPSAVVTSARALAPTSCRYGYVSTRSVYAAWPDGSDESAPLVPADPDAGSSTYAADKRGAELAIERELGPARATHFRAGAILGPEENYGRLPWWLSRLARGGRTLAPGPVDLPLQYVDVRDLARFVWDSLADETSGAVDTVSKSGHTSMGEFLTLAAEVTGARAELVWIDPDWLIERGVTPWRELPLWAPRGHPFGGLHTSDTRRARLAGLRCRPVAETIADTWASIRQGRTPAEPVISGLGMTEATEARLLAEWLGRPHAGSRQG